MNVKILELRDRHTLVPLLCVDMNPDTIGLSAHSTKDETHVAQTYLLRRCGYPCNGHPNIAITRANADGGKCSNDPYFWGDRTYAAAHLHIIKEWANLTDGDVIDVEFIMGETQKPKISERATPGAQI